MVSASIVEFNVWMFVCFFVGTFQPSDELKLKFYGFFKQATEGPNRTKKPPFYDIVGRYKWDAWSKCGEMSKQDAMRSYIEELKKVSQSVTICKFAFQLVSFWQVVETISLTEPVGDFLDQLEPFYEFLPEDIVKAKLPNVDLSKKVTPSRFWSISFHTNPIFPNQSWDAQIIYVILDQS